MKTSNLLKGFIVLTLLTATGSVATTAFAANKMPNNKNLTKQERPLKLTEAQKTEMKSKMDAIKTALEASDYNAWVNAVKALNPNSPELQKITADNFSDYVAKFKERETEKSQMDTKLSAVKAAITANDYNAWVTAVKALNSNSPELEKITADNFSQYAQANNLLDQAHTILKNLGVDEENHRGPGQGMMFGFGHEKNQD